MARKTKQAAEDPAFEPAMRRLADIVDRIETEALDLDEALALFEEGVGLLRVAGARLDEAEDRIRLLLEDAGGLRLDEFDPS